MAAKFLYDRDFGNLKIETDENDEELTEQQAMIVAVRNLSSGMELLGNALWEIAQAFEYKKFYDEDAQSSASPTRASAKKPPTKRSSRKRRL
jgi:hypothetical protein